MSFDILPTLAKLAGADIPGTKIDGREISSVLFEDGAQTTSPHKAFFYFFRGHINAVRSGNWKLFVKRKQESLEQPELYDLDSDIGESKNVATDNPEVVRQLQKLIDEMRLDLGDGEAFPATNMRKAAHVENAQTLTRKAPDELSQTEVFMSGQDGYHTYRIPSLIVTNRGTLLATCEGRKDGRGDHGNLDLVMKRSTDLGASWSDMSVVYEEGGDEKITIGNPCPVVDQETGTIWMPFCKNNDRVLITKSNDDGVTWSEPVDITDQVKLPDWGWYATGPGVGIQLTRGKLNGRLVIPCDHREQINGKWIKISHVFYSDDHGKTWQLGENVDLHTDECQVVELHDGRLMINMRNYWAAEGGKPEHGGKRSVAISDDGGATWGKLTFDEALIEPICQASFLRHNSDTFRESALLFSNPASNSGRHHMTVRASRDQGKTWPTSKLLHEGPAAYSCLTTLPDRSIGCLYEAGGEHPYEKLVFARFSLPWLEATKTDEQE